MITAILGKFLLHYGFQFAMGALALFGAKSLFGGKKPDPAKAISAQAAVEAQAISADHHVAGELQNAQTKEEADAALHALSDLDRK